jgi:hypothetical protein
MMAMTLGQSSRRSHEVLQHIFDIYTEAMLSNFILWRERERRHIDLRLPKLSSPLASTGHGAFLKRFEYIDIPKKLDLVYKDSTFRETETSGGRLRVFCRQREEGHEVEFVEFEPSVSDCQPAHSDRPCSTFLLI